MSETSWNDEVEKWAEDYCGDCSSYVKDLLGRARHSDGDDRVWARINLYNLHAIYHEGLIEGCEHRHPGVII